MNHKRKGTRLEHKTIAVLKAAGYVEGENLTIDSQNPQADQGTLTSIVGTFASSDYDAFYGIATPSAQALAAAITDRPIVFSAVTT